MTLSQLQALSSNRTEAERLLMQTFHLPHFYDEQWQAISALLQGRRILMIERTGFGKSLCFQFPATLMDGITVIFSPLIALMRDQVRALAQLGIPARLINSEQETEENKQTIELALEGKLKILYIAPERQENSEWIEATRKMKLSMVVVDEAHTISVWGHDFRPSFRRIVNLVNLLPEEMPVLACTATATKRVQDDIERQIGRGITTIRGQLMRSNFRLHVIVVGSEEEKMAWLAEHIKQLEGTGLIYTGIRSDTDTYARWLTFCGVEATGYNAGLDANTRKDIEEGLKANRWKCIVSTNALGMGIDKPDIRFIIHTQMPASPIHYYQEIGRAGRDGKPTQIILFFNGTKDAQGWSHDCLLPRAFIDGAKPKTACYQKVIDLLKEELLGEREIVKQCNLKTTQFRVIKADLIEQHIIKEVTSGRQKKYEYQFDAPQLNTESFEQLRKAKMNDLRAMVEYVYTSEPRMAWLCRYLGDPTPVEGGCDNTTEPKYTATLSSEMQARIDEFRQSCFPEIIVEEKKNNIINSVAASFYGVTMVGNAIRRCKYEQGGPFPDFLLGLTLKAFRKTFHQKHLDYVMSVPPTSSGPLVERFARSLADILGVPYSPALIKTRKTDLQKVFHSAYSKRDNVAGAFGLAEDAEMEVKEKTILLIDDIYDSGATLKEIGRLLTHAGAKEIVPLVIAKTVGNDQINL